MHPFHPLSQVLNVDEVSATHAVIMEELARLSAAADVAAAERSLAGLRETLPHHFAMEQDQGGVFEWIEALAPQHTETIRRLLNDHQRLLTELAELGPQYGSDGAPDAPMAGKIAAFVARLRAHEQVESEALFDAMSRAEGG